MRVHFFKVLTSLSVALNLIFIIFAVLNGTVSRELLKLNLLTFRRTLPHQEERYAALREYPAVENGTMLIGDSLTANSPYVDLFSNIHNRGVSGDTSRNILERLDDLTRSKPERVLFQIGINDLLAGVPDAQFMENFKAITRSLKSISASLFVILVYPVNSSFPLTITNSEIKNLNKMIREVKKEVDFKVCDLNKPLTNDLGDLRLDYTSDGIHLNTRAYLAIASDMRQITLGSPEVCN